MLLVSKKKKKTENNKKNEVMGCNWNHGDIPRTTPS